MRFVLNTDILTQIHACSYFRTRFEAKFPKGIDVKWTVEEQLKLMTTPLIRSNMGFGLHHLDVPLLPIYNRTIRNKCFRQIDLLGLRSKNTKFQKCSFEKARFQESNLDTVSFSNCNLRHTAFRGVYLRGKLNNSPLNASIHLSDMELYLRKSPLLDSHIHKSEVSLSFQSTNSVKNLEVSDSTLDLYDKYKQSRFSKMNAVNSGIGGSVRGTLEKSTFTNCLISVNFNNATLKNVKFKNCDLMGSSFVGTVLQNCEFDECELLEHQLPLAKDWVNLVADERIVDALDNYRDRLLQAA